MRGFATIVATVSPALCAENSARRCSFHTSFNFCSSTVNAGCCGMIVPPLCVWNPRNSLHSRTFLLAPQLNILCPLEIFMAPNEGPAGLCGCLQDDLARGFAVFQSSLRFRRFRQREHLINVQPEPALVNPVEHTIRAPQQFFARPCKMAEHPA